MTNDAWADGAANHNPEQGEGDWATRKAAAYRAYLEWMPIRESAGRRHPPVPQLPVWAPVSISSMLDTRALRDKQVADDGSGRHLPIPARSILGAAQETWLFDELRSSQQRGNGLARAGPAGDVLARRSTGSVRHDLGHVGGISGVARPRARFSGGRARPRRRHPERRPAQLVGVRRAAQSLERLSTATGEGSLAVELLAPAISSPPLFSGPGRRELAPFLRALSAALEVPGRRQPRLRAARHHEDGSCGESGTSCRRVLERSAAETRAAAFVCERGSAHLARRRKAATYRGQPFFGRPGVTRRAFWWYTFRSTLSGRPIPYSFQNA